MRSPSPPRRRSRSLATATPTYFTIAQAAGEGEILPDRQTTIWGYNGITPGPTIFVDQDRKAVVRQICALPDRPSDARLQRLDLDAPPRVGVAAGVRRLRERHHQRRAQFKDYQYPNFQDARTLWYHDHGVHITANNAYMGLAAQYIMPRPPSAPCRSRTVSTTCR